MTIEWKFLSGNINWEECGGAFISPAMFNGDWHYWLVINVTECVEDDDNHHYVELRVVAPEALPTKEWSNALQSCGFGDGVVYTEEMLVEVLNSYGIFNTVWQDSGDNIDALMVAAKEEAEMLGITFGYVMDRPTNAMGATGWDRGGGQFVGRYKGKAK